MNIRGYKNSKPISDKDTLSLMQMVHGGNVMCTNGLFHILNNDHNEIYIDKVTAELDKRGLYKTLVVMDNIIVSRVVNNDKVNFVILNKEDLKCLYKTDGNIYYINENIVCDKKDDGCTLISHNGKQLIKINKAVCVNHIHGSNYIVQTSLMFEDKVLYYNKHKDSIIDLTEDKRYTIHINDKDSKKVEVISMEGGKYIYNFEKHECFNTFTNKVEEETHLWKLI